MREPGATTRAIRQGQIAEKAARPISNSHRATTRAIRHAQSAERVAQAKAKFAPRNNENYIRHAQSAEKVSPPISKFATHHKESDPKVPRRLREPRPKLAPRHKRAIRHARTDETCGFHPLLCRGLRSILSLPQKMSPRQKAQTTPRRRLCASRRRLCASQTLHMDNSQGHFHARIYRKNAGAQRERERERERQREREKERERERASERAPYHDLTPAFNTYRKNPSVWTHCLGNSRNHHSFPHKNILSVFRRSSCLVRAVKAVISLNNLSGFPVIHSSISTLIIYCYTCMS